MIGKDFLDSFLGRKLTEFVSARAEAKSNIRDLKPESDSVRYEIAERKGYIEGMRSLINFLEKYKEDDDGT